VQAASRGSQREVENALGLVRAAEAAIAAYDKTTGSNEDG
jgi:hypothetical protein